MNSSKRNLYIGASATVLFGAIVFAFLLPSAPEPAPKLPIVIEPVHMPPPPPEPTPEQLATAKAAEEAAAAEAEALVKAEADAKSKALADAKRKQQPKTQKKVSASKGKRVVTEVAVVPKEEPPKPKEVRFNMTQDGKKMSAEDFDAWMKAQGIRIVPAKPVAPVKTDDGSGN